ncbi:MAG: hypothetical protein ACOH1O_12265 [Flavobacterium sp.]
MNLLTNICKSTMLATAVFWILLGSDRFEAFMFGLIPLSMIPIFICCAITISLTIFPLFWWLKSSKFDKKQVFETFFPAYSIVAFGLCVALIVSFDFESYSIAFATSAFISTSQSWIWMANSSTISK